MDEDNINGYFNYVNEKLKEGIPVVGTKKSSRDILRDTFAFLYLQGELTAEEVLLDFRLVDLYFGDGKDKV